MSSGGQTQSDVVRHESWLLLLAFGPRFVVGVRRFAHSWSFNLRQPRYILYISVYLCMYSVHLPSLIIAIT